MHAFLFLNYGGRIHSFNYTSNTCIVFLSLTPPCICLVVLHIGTEDGVQQDQRLPHCAPRRRNHAVSGLCYVANLHHHPAGGLRPLDGLIVAPWRDSTDDSSTPGHREWVRRWDLTWTPLASLDLTLTRGHGTCSATHDSATAWTGTLEFLSQVNCLAWCR